MREAAQTASSVSEPELEKEVKKELDQQVLMAEATVRRQAQAAASSAEGQDLFVPRFEVISDECVAGEPEVDQGSKEASNEGQGSMEASNEVEQFGSELEVDLEGATEKNTQAEQPGSEPEVDLKGATDKNTQAEQPGSEPEGGL